MPLTQDDIRNHYEQEWRTRANSTAEVASLAYSNPVEDAVVYPIYEQLLRDLKIQVEGGRVLDVGCGSGRWVRFFFDRFAPAELVGVDFTQAAIELLRAWASRQPRATPLRFETADITHATMDVGAIAGAERRGFDLINVANVLFHIPEPDKFASAMKNLATLVSRDGRIVTTEYLPHATMRTEWMLVRSRYEFEAAVNAAGLRIVDVRPASFFANDPMGLDGPDQAVRGHFHQVRAAMQRVQGLSMDDNSKAFFTQFFADIDRCLLAYARERIAAVDFPSQKLVVLAKTV